MARFRDLLDTERDPSLWEVEIEARRAFFAGSAVLADQRNWQTVLFVGYGDDRERLDGNRFEPASREQFLKLSYAFPR